MSIQVVNDTNVNVNTMTMTANFVVNQVFLTLFRIIRSRNLPPQYLSERRKIIEDGIFTWISEQTLKLLALEVFQEGSDQAIERFEFNFKYTADPVMDVNQPAVHAIEEFLGTLFQLPEDAVYQVLVQLQPGATDVSGWKSSRFKELNITQEKELGDWGFGNASVDMRYLGNQEYLRVEVSK